MGIGMLHGKPFVTVASFKSRPVVVEIRVGGQIVSGRPSPGARAAHSPGNEPTGSDQLACGREVGRAAQRPADLSLAPTTQLSYAVGPRRGPEQNTKRLISFLLIVLLHVGLVLGLIKGFEISKFNHEPDALLVQLIQEPRRPDDPAPRPRPPSLEPVLAITVPVPLINIRVPIESPVLVTTTPPRTPEPASVPVVAPVGTRINPHFVHAIDMSRYYPAASRRAEEQGVVVLHVCVKVNGRYEGRPTLVSSSGYPSLDEAGIAMVLDNSMTPALVQGAPAPACIDLAVEFALPR